MAFASHSFVFLGPPASGKGTQGRRLSDEKGWAYLSTGALLRGALRDDTELGRLAKPYLDRGEYVPDDIMLPGVLDWVKSQGGGWVLDGFPRTVPQAEALDAALEEIGFPLP
ncbi:MAG: nucleoside monophosphate kinase, partial [Verrucomicrobiaceae bacterium]|nr:nucleoside monophosphate kinase [Verrucomicrobiaceae bacterium]